MNKKAQFGKLLTWLVGFIIICFVATLFLIFTSLLSGQKFLKGDSDEITLSKFNLDLRSQNLLLSVLNDKMEDGQSVKEFVINGIDNPSNIKDPLKQFIENRFNRLGKCEYIFLVEYDIDNLKERLKDKKKALTYRKVQFGSINDQKLINKMEGLSFFAGDVWIRTKLYLGVCRNDYEK